MQDYRQPQKLIKPEWQITEPHVLDRWYKKLSNPILQK